MFGSLYVHFHDGRISILTYTARISTMIMKPIASGARSVVESTAVSSTVCTNKYVVSISAMRPLKQLLINAELSLVLPHFDEPKVVQHELPLTSYHSVLSAHSVAPPWMLTYWSYANNPYKLSIFQPINHILRKCRKIRTLFLRMIDFSLSL